MPLKLIGEISVKTGVRLFKILQEKLAFNFIFINDSPVHKICEPSSVGQFSFSLVLVPFGNSA